jgi:hypothetical protein
MGNGEGAKSVDVGTVGREGTHNRIATSQTGRIKTMAFRTTVAHFIMTMNRRAI